jgi:hypothetical protein
VKARTLVSESWFSSAKLTEVFRRLGNNIGAKFHNNATDGLAAYRHIKEDFGVGPKKRDIKRNVSETTIRKRIRNDTEEVKQSTVQRKALPQQAALS